MRLAEIDNFRMVVDHDILNIDGDGDTVISVFIESDTTTLMNRLLEVIEEKQAAIEVEDMMITYSEASDIFTITTTDEDTTDLASDVFKQLCEGILNG
jgi:DNA-directed RNA polymerase subunit L